MGARRGNVVKGWSVESLRAHVRELERDPKARYEWACALCCTARELGLFSRDVPVRGAK